MEEPQANAARPDSEHYREMARKLRELAREFRFPGARQELLDLAGRYERRADQLDERSAAASEQDHHSDCSRSRCRSRSAALYGSGSHTACTSHNVACTSHNVACITQ